MFFSLQYGTLHYDLAGNWCSMAWGLKYGTKIGWIRFSEYPPSPVVTMFDPSADDTVLFSASTWDALRSSSLEWQDQWLFEGGFLPMLASDANTPEPSLMAMATNYLSLDIADRLLGNPTAQASRGILTVIANHPVQDAWDPWLQIRDRARVLLNALP